MWNGLFIKQNLQFSGPPARPLWIGRWCAIKTFDLGGKWLFIATRWNSFWRLVISNHFWPIATPQKEPWRRDHRETERGNRDKLTPWHMQCVCWCVYACVSDTDTSTKSLYCSDVQWTQCKPGVEKYHKEKRKQLGRFKDVPRQHWDTPKRKLHHAERWKNGF